MNVNLRLSLPFKKKDTQEKVTKEVRVNSNLLLNPFYATEEDILNPYNEIGGVDLEWIRKSIFNASLTVYRLTLKLEGSRVITPRELALMRRDFTICLAVNETGKHMNKEITSELSRSKSLGDFSVSTKKKGDLTALSKILKDSSDCIEEMKNLIEDLLLVMVEPSMFVKSSQNESRRESNRLWWLSELDEKVYDSFASVKHEYKGRKWKAGFRNTRK